MDSFISKTKLKLPFYIGNCPKTIEKVFIQKRRQRSALLFGVQNLFNSLTHLVLPCSCGKKTHTNCEVAVLYIKYSKHLQDCVGTLHLMEQQQLKSKQKTINIVYMVSVPYVYKKNNRNTDLKRRFRLYWDSVATVQHIIVHYFFYFRLCLCVRLELFPRQKT